MGVRVVRLGSARAVDEGTRIGTVRRPPRGVPKAEFASQNWYDVWFPNLAPSLETMKLGQAARPPGRRRSGRYSSRSTGPCCTPHRCFESRGPSRTWTA